MRCEFHVQEKSFRIIIGSNFEVTESAFFLSVFSFYSTYSAITQCLKTRHECLILFLVPKMITILFAILLKKMRLFQVIVKHCAQQEISYSLQPPILKCIGNRYSIER